MVPLPLSLEIVGTDRSRDDNEGAMREGWWVGNKKRELGDENASCSEHRGSQLLGVGGSTWAGGSPVRAQSAMTSEKPD